MLLNNDYVLVLLTTCSIMVNTMNDETKLTDAYNIAYHTFIHLSQISIIYIPKHVHSAHMYM